MFLLLLVFSPCATPQTAAANGRKTVLDGVFTRDQAARNGVEAALKGRPGAFFTADSARFITTGNFDDDMPRVRECDWIIEAVTENLGIKRSLYDRVLAHRAPGTVVSTNTSGIPLAQISEGYPAEFREHFLGTHFFNPPRYLHLVELIPGNDTRADIFAAISDFCDRHLGKGVVPCKDTPNFIGNRIGAFFGATVQKLTIEHDFTITFKGDDELQLEDGDKKVDTLKKKK